ncbi:MAG: chloride channel protein [Betaproteobacteria bacterium]|jgi:H+/Cl- antiporter ClcA
MANGVLPQGVIRRGRHVWLNPRLWMRRVTLWLGAILVGVAAIAFAKSAEYANSLHQRLVDASPLLPFIVGPLGLASVVWLTRRFFAGSQGSGIPQTIAVLGMENVKDKDSYLSLRTAIGKFGLTVLGLLSGASVGREGPTVQIGASIMHVLGKFTRFSRVEMQRGLILAGGAAGVSAAFNTPLAGIVFAIEEMSRNFESKTSGTVLTAVIVSGIVSLWWLGDYTYFGSTSAVLYGSTAWVPVLLCGIICGLLGGLFSQLLIVVSKGLPGKIGRFAKSRPVLFAACCGFLLALLGVASGGVTYGTGYHEARAILEGTANVPETFGLLKLLATLISYVSGIPGGVFAPSLSVGAGLGHNLAALMPYAPIGAVVVLGMVAYFAGVVQAPVTAFVIVMEMTDNHDMIVPLMAASLLAAGTSKIVCRKPLYRALADQFLLKEEASRSS